MALTEEIVLMLSWLTKGGFVQQQAVETGHVFCCTGILRSRHWCAPLRPPHDDAVAAFTDVEPQTFCDKLLRPMVAVNFFLSKESEEKRKKAPKLSYLQNMSLTPICQDLRVLMQAWRKWLPLFKAGRKPLSHSEFACPRFRLLLEHPSESTIFRVGKIAVDVFKLKFVFINYSH